MYVLAKLLRKTDTIYGVSLVLKTLAQHYEKVSNCSSSGSIISHSFHMTFGPDGAQVTCPNDFGNPLIFSSSAALRLIFVVFERNVSTITV